MGRNSDAGLGSNTTRGRPQAVTYQAGIGVGHDLWANCGYWVKLPVSIFAFDLEATVVVSLPHPCELDLAQKAVVVMRPLSVAR